MKDKKVIGSGMNRFTKGKSCLSNLIDFYIEVTGKFEADTNRGVADRPDGCDVLSLRGTLVTWMNGLPEISQFNKGKCNVLHPSCD